MNDQATRISALITLLGDPDASVHGLARHKLLEMRRHVLPALERAAEEARNPDALERILGVITCVHALEIDEEFEVFAQQKDHELDLEAGCILLAKLSYPEVRTFHIVDQLDAMGAELTRRVAGLYEPLERVEEIGRYLFNFRGFRSHEADSDDPDNTFINRVLERRRGLPIALSVVTILVGRRAGLPIFGVGLPGHYIVKYHDGDHDILFDPWGGGTVLTRQYCAELVGSWGIVLTDHHLQITSDRATLQRMCRSLIKPFWRRGDHQRLGHVVRFLHMLEESGRGADLG